MLTIQYVSMIADKLNISAIEAKYQGGEASSFHPRMMPRFRIALYK